ncbi:unnamed protein product [Brachionus calyciflorus]|uniref:Endonuclease/exonuclease/phosphatase domain-containing protein n=1 Tax=Brachionus calyciflorus TaxID=104777 RepID=A0A813M523_9BILA|nr:unnamed protein product [Brachionus calyciflorus]
MTDPISLIDNWPSIGQGNHSDATKKHHEWLKSIAVTVKALKFRIEEQDRLLAEKDEEINQLKSNLTSSTSPTPSNFSYSNMVANNPKKTEAEIFILTRVHAELKEKSKIENNLIVSGLEEPDVQSDVDPAEQEKIIVENLFKELEVNGDKVKRFTRLRRKGGKKDENKPDLLLIEFTDQSKVKALSKAIKLRETSRFNKVFVNPDKTPAEREGEAKLRHRRNQLNQALPNKPKINSNLSIENLKPKINKLSCYYTNATSLANKKNELRIIIDQCSPDLVGVTETWFNLQSIRTIDGFTQYSKDRLSGNGGGVIIYVKNSYKSFEVTEEELNVTSIEHVWCKIISGKDILLVGCIYRPPNSTREISTQINKVISQAKHLVEQKKFTSLLIFGDFNHPNIKWSNLGGHCSSRFAQSCEFFGLPRGKLFASNNP